MLALGRTNPLKNLPLTLDAWRCADASRAPSCACSASSPSSARARACATSSRPSDEQVNELFNEATVFVQTSTHEGFCAAAAGGDGDGRRRRVHRRARQPRLLRRRRELPDARADAAAVSGGARAPARRPAAARAAAARRASRPPQRVRVGAAHRARSQALEEMARAASSCGRRRSGSRERSRSEPRSRSGGLRGTAGAGALGCGASCAADAAPGPPRAGDPPVKGAARAPPPGAARPRAGRAATTSSCSRRMSTLGAGRARRAPEAAYAAGHHHGRAVPGRGRPRGGRRRHAAGGRAVPRPHSRGVLGERYRGRPANDLTANGDVSGARRVGRLPVPAARRTRAGRRRVDRTSPP